MDSHAFPKGSEVQILSNAVNIVFAFFSTSILSHLMGLLPPALLHEVLPGSHADFMQLKLLLRTASQFLRCFPCCGALLVGRGQLHHSNTPAALSHACIVHEIIKPGLLSLRRPARQARSQTEAPQADTTSHPAAAAAPQKATRPAPAAGSHIIILLPPPLLPPPVARPPPAPNRRSSRAAMLPAIIRRPLRPAHVGEGW